MLQLIHTHARPNAARYPSVVHLPDNARSMGMYLVAGRGSGKSRFMGRILCWQDFCKLRAQVILDPNGSTIDNFLDKISRLPERQRELALTRIRYIDMSGKTGSIVPWPLYTRQSHESLYETAQRFLEVLKRVDPALTTASVEGFNALAEVGTYTGMVLTALGWQISHATALITKPTQFADELYAVAQAQPEVQPAVTYLLKTLEDLKPADKERKVAAFIRKLAPFNLDPVMRAMFSTSAGALDWQQVVDQGETVLLDFRHVLDLERRRFMMLWVFQSFLRFIQQRGAGRHTPIGLVIDELTALYNFDAQSGSDIFAADLDHLINVLARNYRVWLTLANQELFQIDLKSRKTLLGMGTKIIGVTTDSEAALTLAKEFFPYDPTLIKKHEPVFDAQGMLTDLKSIEWTITEQQVLAARRFMTLKPFHFLVKPALGEGNVTGGLVPMSIAAIEPGIWINEAAVVALRRQLAAASGTPLAALLQPPPASQVPDPAVVEGGAHATLNPYADDQGSDLISNFAESYRGE